MSKNSTRFFVHNFTDIESAGFCAKEYSRLKFGSDIIAKKFGYELADALAAKHLDKLLANPILVIPSPYNHVENAATILTKHFVNRLNAILVANSGNHVEYSIIHRKVNYIQDYGFLPKDQRKGLIDNDSFYLNKDFYKDKLLIFVDDVRITGTHEDKLVEILDKENITNDTFFLYYANYEGNNPEIEAQINFASIKSLTDYVSVSQEPNHHIIVRPLKYLLGQSTKDLAAHLVYLEPDKVDKIYAGCLGEGYYKIPKYQENFGVISKAAASI